MGDKTAISWTSKTWNPWRGCTRVSPGCAHCYALARMDKLGFDPFTVTRTKTWADPLRWQVEAQAAGIQERVFTCSWSDWFHPDADPWRAEAWDIVRRCPNLILQILTKRAELIPARLPPDWKRHRQLHGPTYEPPSVYVPRSFQPPGLTYEPPSFYVPQKHETRLSEPYTGYLNVWLGVSVETPNFLHRMDLLRQIPAAVRFISAEPLLAPLGTLNLEGFHWVIVGGESGPGFRPMDHAWAREIRDQCQREQVAFFFKQSAAIRTEMGTQLDGREWKEYPK